MRKAYTTAARSGFIPDPPAPLGSAARVPGMQEPEKEPIEAPQCDASHPCQGAAVRRPPSPRRVRMPRRRQQPVETPGEPIEEPVAWRGPIVMNTQEQLREAFQELEQGTFLKK